MGKRRDRRHATPLGGGGRRMKLDLWNDDDVEKSSTKGKILSITATVEEGDEKTGVGSDEGHSPHSLPGPVQVNPLSLLGQYSDEEEDEDQSSLANGPQKGVSANVGAGQVDEQVASFLADLETSGLLKDETTTNQNGLETARADKPGSPSTAQDAGSARNILRNGDSQEAPLLCENVLPSTAAENGEIQDMDSQDAVCEWEAVLYKESGEYYFWNKVTGETTWEKPTALSKYEEWKERDLQEGQKQSAEDYQAETKPNLELLSTIENFSNQEVKVELSKKESNAGDLMEDVQLVAVSNELTNPEHPQQKDADVETDDDDSDDIFPEVREKAEKLDHASRGVEDNHAALQEKEEADSNPVARDQGDAELYQAGNIDEGKKDVLPDDSPELRLISSPVSEVPYQTINLAETTGSDRPDFRTVPELARRKDHSRLLERGETLAERFKVLAGENLRSLSLRLRLLVEAEVRLSDCKAMASHNAAQDEFWEHMDLQMTRLESLLTSEEAAANMEAEQQVFSSGRDGLQGEHMQLLKKRAPAFRALRPPLQLSHSDPNRDIEVVKEEEGQVGNMPAQPEIFEVLSPKADSLSDKPGERGVEASGSISHAKIMTDDEDTDVDMDVDMEVEDGKQLGVPVDTLPVDMIPRAGVIPSSYNYPVPVVPAEPLPQAVSYIPPDSLPQAISYNPPAIAMPAVVETPLFPSVSPLFPSVHPTAPNRLPLFPAETWVPPPPPDDDWAPPPLPDSEAPPPPPEDEPPPLPPSPEDTAPGVSSALPRPLSPPVQYLVEQNVTSSSYYPLAPNQSTGDSDQISKLEPENYYADSANLTVEDVEPASAYINGTFQSNVAVSTTAIETTSKKSGKAVRGKKRTHASVAASLRSNKKVSSMVNKWLAAKEELHSSEEEEEDKALFDVEALEKKRQKEIEEWRHQTLASGGALENANFQPLGTLDWRERVKRAKKESKKEAAKQVQESKSEESKKEITDATEDFKPEAAASVTPPKRADLKELSKDLPSGWQAFWDVESGEVYYGNLTTSETSWERPTS